MNDVKITEFEHGGLAIESHTASSFQMVSLHADQVAALREHFAAEQQPEHPLPYYESAMTALSAQISADIKAVGGYHTEEGARLGRILHDTNSIIGNVRTHLALAAARSLAAEQPATPGLDALVVEAIDRLNAASIPPIMTEAQFNAATILDVRTILTRRLPEQPATPTPSEVIDWIVNLLAEGGVGETTWPLAALGVQQKAREHFAALVSPVSEQPATEAPERDPDYDAGVYFCADCGKRSSMYGHMGRCKAEQPTPLDPEPWRDINTLERFANRGWGQRFRPRRGFEQDREKYQ